MPQPTFVTRTLEPPKIKQCAFVTFYRASYASTVLAVMVCLSVCLYVCSSQVESYTKMVKPRITLTMPYDLSLIHI